MNIWYSKATFLSLTFDQKVDHTSFEGGGFISKLLPFAFVVLQKVNKKDLKSKVIAIVKALTAHPHLWNKREKKS